MKPLYVNTYIADEKFEKLFNETSWINKEAPRDECFMALESLEYTYGNGFTRRYKSLPVNEDVLNIMNKLNKDYRTEYNVCFLNYYKNEKEHLGWHADDSPKMDSNHPIAVVSFGANRYIWCKKKEYKGVIPEEDKYLLNSGSLFVMPSGFQKENLHKIPKNDRPCGGRISLTFRKFIK
jgi:alkylated DNA repair dioxygenase AlkB